METIPEISNGEKMEEERLKFCIARFDHYYDSINNKSAVFLGLGTFSLGGLIASYPYLMDHVNCSKAILGLLLLSSVLALSALIIVIVVSTPYLSKGKKSMLYFNSIATKGLDIFIEDTKNFNMESGLSDLRLQVHDLATGLRKKFKRLRIAAILYTLMFVSIIPLVFLILLNFKN